MLELYGENGEVIAGGKCYAVTERIDNKAFYRVLVKSGRLYKKDFSLRDKREGWTLRDVTETCFNMYIEYLKTNFEHRYYEALRLL